ncbi:secondary thiamine-phosphate synthase enzyme YjbQ [Tepidanaerobacter sp. EBM-49]|uniref:secondary thiamine-phosphate synthase enzyme YjbQ n=1 Tax=Tepidanaerobacter sp. EBM-49 TaxID=1918504 RepID=UPI000A48EE29|nr:secondary thiamine-phosphate synthase enzyme YjbQ [Tepidanaerobacter sp. EBM-49]
MQKYTIRTEEHNQMLDITTIVQKSVDESEVRDGMCYIFIPHTTAGITINEGADKDVSIDILETLDKLVPHNGDYRHLEGNSDAHIKASLVGDSLTLIVREGKLLLGTWQRIFFCEFDGPRTRNIIVKVVEDK